MCTNVIIFTQNTKHNILWNLDDAATAKTTINNNYPLRLFPLSSLEYDLLHVLQQKCNRFE